MLGRLGAKLRARLAPRLSDALIQRLNRWSRPARLGIMGRTTPLSNHWGFDRGTPVDRHYIERFLAAHRQDIRGRVLEVKNAAYTSRFGEGVERGDVVDIDPANPDATIIADLATAEHIGADQFDCFILTQTLQFIYDTRAVIRHIHRVLRPRGVALITVPCVSRIAPRYGLSTDYWRFTAASCSTLFAETFGAEHVTVRSYGNVLAGIAFLTGIALEELNRRDLEVDDPYFPLIVSVRAFKWDATANDALARPIRE